VHIYHIFFIHSSANGHWDWFHIEQCHNKHAIQYLFCLLTLFAYLQRNG
jgi:hypothetical protein